MHKKPLRYDQMEVVLGARHGDIEQTALFFDLRARARAKVRRDASVDDVEGEDGFPFLAQAV